MGSQEKLVEEEVLKQMAQDIGIDNARRFIETLGNEFQKRIENIRQAIEDNSFDGLAIEAHALKSKAQISGAFILADALIKLEVESNKKNKEAIKLAQDVLTLADLTRITYLDISLSD
ncbi:MAG: hypothetical protein HOH14_12370 [Gammaproteobacteria bacterium]|nr:hypothetical protein [Gammaproteobacteria bacterium]MBT6044274.1 hypothetical protein [Gammaproteobacteria bacterium]